MPSYARWPASISCPRRWGRSSRPTRQRPLPQALAGDLAQLGPVMPGRDVAHSARARAHADRFGVGRAPGVGHALERLAAGDARGREERVLAPAEAVLVQHLVQVVAGVDGGLALLIAAGPEPAEYLTARALDGRSRQYALGRSPDTPQQVHGRALRDCRQRRRHIAVGDQANASAGLPDLAHVVLVARSVEHDH